MRGKLLFVTGAAVGYVLGARAGRKRYEQIKSAANKVWESPGIQKQVNAVEDFVAEKVGDVPGLVYEGAKKLVVQATTRQKELRTVIAAKSAPAAKTAPAAPAAKTAAAKAAPAKTAAAKAAPQGSTGAKKPTVAKKPAGTAKPTGTAKPAASKPDADDASA
ncbi:MAG TPA: hypothetical protein VGN33_06485 [Leifsonia sp.]|nr:hypothetical protein [Leifsonia sp.]